MAFNGCSFYIPCVLIFEVTRPGVHIFLCAPIWGCYQSGIKEPRFRRIHGTYTVVSSPFADLPDIRSPGVDGPPVMSKGPYAYVVAAFHAPSSPDYVPGPKYPPSLDFVPEPVYPEFMPLEDEFTPSYWEQPYTCPINEETGHLRRRGPLASNHTTSAYAISARISYQDETTDYLFT
ncbi:hypothetical protein Tco_1420509 [Tanacetum coccineum]